MNDYYTCPVTGELVELDRDEIETESCFTHAPGAKTYVECHSCGGHHDWDKVQEAQKELDKKESEEQKDA